ncbi:hypothetical protein VTO42DRAFT_395 [Malbranchea cinnamomea]
MHFQHPIRCLRRFSCANWRHKELLVATAGPKIHLFDAKTGLELFSWPSNFDLVISKAVSPSNGTAGGGEHEPPEKRRKVSSVQIEEASEKSGDSKSVSSETRKSTEPSWTSIPILVVTKKGDHVIAVTAEDKCVRVFEISQDGKLSQLTERPMPKRPCAITLAGNDSTILVGDKFGDVYALPLLSTDKPAQPAKKKSDNPKTFQPSASTLTVHTQRNRRALEQQLRQIGTKITEKSVPTFEKTLLLGHVSMLTDVAFVSLPSETGTSRDYILTSDRDEHIRLSRGPPQSYVIEGYCQGHTSFVSKLCVPRWDPKTLISGGGDNFILVWDWLDRRIRQKVDLNREDNQSDSVAREVTVAGIWAVPLDGHPELHDKGHGVVLVALEGSPRLLSFVFDNDRRLLPLSPYQLQGNVLDVTSIDGTCQLLISTDNVHEPGSTRTRRSTPPVPQRMLNALTLSTSPSGLKWEECSSPAVDVINEHGTSQIQVSGNEKDDLKQAGTIAQSLYGLGDLRKRGREDD